MGRDHRRRQCEERAGNGWFMREDIDAGAANPSLRERLRQRFFIDDPAPGGVDHDRLRLELGNRLSIQQVKRLGILRNVERHDVGAPQERLVVDRSRPKFGEALGRDVGIVGENAHLEGSQPPGDLRSDPAQADDAHRATAKIYRTHLFALPAPGASRDVGGHDLAGDGEQ